MAEDYDDGPTQSHVVRVLPAAIEFAADHDELLMSAANRAGYYWPTACAGDAVCTRCVFVVTEHDREAVSPMQPRERDALQSVRWGSGERAGERLACQARVLGDVTVAKKYVRASREGDLLPFT